MREMICVNHVYVFDSAYLIYMSRNVKSLPCIKYINTSFGLKTAQLLSDKSSVIRKERNVVFVDNPKINFIYPVTSSDDKNYAGTMESLFERTKSPEFKDNTCYLLSDFKLIKLSPDTPVKNRYQYYYRLELEVIRPEFCSDTNYKILVMLVFSKGKREYFGNKPKDMEQPAFQSPPLDSQGRAHLSFDIWCSTSDLPQYATVRLFE